MRWTPAGTVDRMPADIDSAQYVSFVSRKKDGTAVPLPVWIAPFEDGYTFTTDEDSWKVKRVRRNPAVTIQACSMRGRVHDGAPVHAGTAEVLLGERALAARAAVKSKYPIAYALLLTWSDRRAARKGGSPTAGVCAIKVTLTD